MPSANYLFTSESVSEGHPDKVCDRISDAIVDGFLGADPEARVACETLTTTNRIVIAGEVRGPAPLVDADGKVNTGHVEEIARAAVREIGYEQEGFHWQKADVAVHLHGQSGDIAQGVDADGNKDEGAGDQGIMFGYACTETEALMPAPIHLSHQILKSLSEARHSGALPLLGPDAKSQVTLRYENGKPVGASSIVVSAQHSEKIDADAVREIVRPHVVNVLPDGWMCDEAEFYVNPTGRFVIGGPDGDAGLTGRKIIVDTYGGSQRPMAAAPSRARTRPRWTGRRPTPRAISPRMSWLPAWRKNALSSSPTRSPWPGLCRSMSTLPGPGRWTRRDCPPPCRR